MKESYKIRKDTIYLQFQERLLAVIYMGAIHRWSNVSY